MHSFEDIEAGIRIGCFARSLAELEAHTKDLRRLDPIRFDVTRAELLYNTSQVAAASSLAVTLLNGPGLSSSHAARLAYVAAMSAFEGARFSDSLDYINKSLRVAQAAKDARLVAIAQLGLFRLIADAEDSRSKGTSWK